MGCDGSWIVLPGSSAGQREHSGSHEAERGECPLRWHRPLLSPSQSPAGTTEQRLPQLSQSLRSPPADFAPCRSFFYSSKAPNSQVLLHRLPTLSLHHHLPWSIPFPWMPPGELSLQDHAAPGGRKTHTPLPASILPFAFPLGYPRDQMKLPRAVSGDCSVINAIALPALSRGTGTGKGPLAAPAFQAVLWKTRTDALPLEC